MKIEDLAMENVKRVARPPRGAGAADRFDWLDDHAAQRPEWIAAFLEMKTVWHPSGCERMAGAAHHAGTAVVGGTR